jgi:uncharacterized protein (TIGR02996 family)
MSALRATLERASEACAAGRLEAAAEALRGAWRDSRDPSLAGYYELLLADLRRSSASPRLAGDDPGARALAWRELAERDRGLVRALPVLVDEPFHPDLPELERLRLLSRWTPDPLLAAALARRLRLPLVDRDQPGAAQIAVETIRLLAAQRDPRQLQTLETLARAPGMPSTSRRQLRGAIASLEATPIRRLRAEHRATLAGIDARARAQRARDVRGAELLAAIHADPDADAPRLVYADWLSSLGDPRGEFITLQVERAGAGAGTRASERERALLRRHVDAWTGELHGVLGRDGRVFERGFLASASIEASRVEGELLDAGAWTTLHTLDGHVPDALALRGRLAKLRTLYGFLDLDRFTSLRAAGHLASVERFEATLEPHAIERFDTPLAVRALLVRHASPPVLAALVRSPLAAELDELGLFYLPRELRAQGINNWSSDHRDYPTLATRLALLDELSRAVARVRLLDLRTARASRPVGCELTLTRGEAGQLSRARLDVHAPPASSREPIAAALAGVLDDLGPRLTRVTLGEVELGRHDRAALVELLAAACAPGCAVVDGAEPEAQGSSAGGSGGGGGGLGGPGSAGGGGGAASSAGGAGSP